MMILCKLQEGEKLPLNNQNITKDIVNDLKEIRNSSLVECLRDFIDIFVDESFKEERFPYVPLSPPQYETTRNQYDDFCSAYLISILCFIKS